MQTVRNSTAIAETQQYHKLILTTESVSADLGNIDNMHSYLEHHHPPIFRELLLQAQSSYDASRASTSTMSPADRHIDLDRDLAHHVHSIVYASGMHTHKSLRTCVAFKVLYSRR